MLVRTFFMYLMTFGYIVSAAHCWFSYFKDGMRPVGVGDRMLVFFSVTATALAAFFVYTVLVRGQIPPSGVTWLGWTLNFPAIMGIALIDRYVVGQKIMGRLIRELGEQHRGDGIVV